MSEYSQLRGHQAFDAIQTQFLNEVRELKQLAHTYVNRQYDKAIDTFVAKLEAPTDDLFGGLLPIYRETRFQIHQLVVRLKESRQNNTSDQQNLNIKNYIASVLHDCLDGIDLCPAGVHSRFSQSFLDLEAILHGGLAGAFYKLRNDLFREFVQAFLWQNQRSGKISVAAGMQVHWFNALYNLYCGSLALAPIDDPQAITNLPDELLSGFLQSAPVSVNACVILRRIVDSWCAQLTKALAVVGCSHWLNGPTQGNENTAIGIDALINRVFNPVNNVMGTATDNPLNFDAVMDLCDSESFHLKRHREKMLAWITGHFYRDSTTVFAETLVFGRSKVYIGSISELFFWVFDDDQPLRPGQACCFSADQHSSLKLTHLRSIDFSSWSASTSHALLTQAVEQTDEPDDIVAFFLDCNVTTQLNAVSQPVRQAVSNQLHGKLLRCTSAFREILCQKVCSYFACCGTKAISGHSLEWLIDTPLLEPVLLELSQRGIDVSRVTQRLNSWQISDWQRLRELLLPDDCRRLFRQAFHLHQVEGLGHLLLTGHCDRLAYSSSDLLFNEHRFVPQSPESLLNLFARHGNLVGLKYLLVLVQRYTLSQAEACQAQAALINQRCEKGRTPLINAAMYGHVDCLRELLNISGVDVNLADDAGCTPLHLAALCGRVHCVRVLLQTDSLAVNGKTLRGETPLNNAVLGGHLDIVRMLLALTNIDVNEGCCGVTPLLRAARNGYTEIVQALLAVPGIDVNAKSSDGWTPLNSAACKGFTSCVRLLLNVPGVLVNETNSYGCSPLNHAARGGHFDCVRLLLEAPGIDVNLACCNGLTPLFRAVWSGHSGTVRAILAAKDVLVNAESQGRTALHYATRLGYPDIVRVLLQTPGVSVNVRQETGRTPLITAAEKGHWQCVRELLNAPGISVNQAENTGWAPLHMAARYGQLQSLQLLLRAPGIEVNRPNSFGWVPLHHATYWQHWECVQALLQVMGIQVNLLTPDGYFALGIAAERGDLSSLQILLAAPGIEVNKSGRFGATALNLAANCGHVQCIEALLQVRGIDLDNRDHSNLRPLDLAIRGGFRECVRLLQRARTSSVNERFPGDGLPPPAKVARRR